MDGSGRATLGSALLTSQRHTCAPGRTCCGRAGTWSVTRGPH